MVTIDTRKGAGEARRGSVGGSGIKITPRARKVVVQQSGQLLSDSDSDVQDIVNKDGGKEDVGIVVESGALIDRGVVEDVRGAEELSSGFLSGRSELSSHFKLANDEFKTGVAHAIPIYSRNERNASLPFAALLPRIGVVGDLFESRTFFEQRLGQVQASIVSEPDENSQAKVAELLMLKQAVQWLGLGDSNE